MKFFGGEGFQILPSFSAAPLTLETFLKSLEPEGNVLAIEPQTQRSSLWCYAACASMAIQFIKQTDEPEQCRIAGFVTHGTNGDPDLQHCCTSPAIDPVCVARGCKVVDIGDIYAHYGISFKDDGNHDVLGQVGFDVLQAEFDAGRPVQIVIRWAPNEGGGKHALLVAGIRGQQLFVLDPLTHHPFMGWCTIESLKVAFGHGTWIRTWPELKLKPE
jgi:hypothetical protein